MTPQERELLTNLVNRLRQTPAQDLDSEAESMINDLVREKPETPYILAQTVLIQDYALHQAQARIADLEKQAKEGKHEGGFLSAIFGSGKPEPRPEPRPQPSYQPQPTYAPQPQPAYAQPGPWGAGPQAAPQYFAQPAGQPSFLRSAATTAAGVAGGALLFQGIESLFGGRGGYGGFGPAGFGGGFGPQPGITETVINNYYEEPGAGATQADFGQGGGPGQGEDISDAAFDQAFDDGGDFGGGNDDFV
jgi:hypothetical protein